MKEFSRDIFFNVLYTQTKVIVPNYKVVGNEEDLLAEVYQLLCEIEMQNPPDSKLT